MKLQRIRVRDYAKYPLKKFLEKALEHEISGDDWWDDDVTELVIRWCKILWNAYLCRPWEKYGFRLRSVNAGTDIIQITIDHKDGYILRIDILPDDDVWYLEMCESINSDKRLVSGKGKRCSLIGLNLGVAKSYKDIMKVLGEEK